MYKHTHEYITGMHAYPYNISLDDMLSNICIHTFHIHTYMHACIHTYTHKYISHTYIHTYIRTYIQCSTMEHVTMDRGHVALRLGTPLDDVWFVVISGSVTLKVCNRYIDNVSLAI